MQNGKRTLSLPKGLRSSPCCIALSIIIALAVILALFVGISAAIIGKIKQPSITVKNFTLSSFDVGVGQQGLIPQPQISLTLDVLLEALNPNNIDLHFDPIIMNVTFLDTMLGRMQIDHFLLRIKKRKLVNSTLAVENYGLISAVPLLVETLIIGRPIKLGVLGWTKASVRFLGVNTSKRKVTFECDVVFEYVSRRQTSTSCKYS